MGFRSYSEELQGVSRRLKAPCKVFKRLSKELQVVLRGVSGGFSGFLGDLEFISGGCRIFSRRLRSCFRRCKQRFKMFLEFSEKFQDVLGDFRCFSSLHADVEVIFGGFRAHRRRCRGSFSEISRCTKAFQGDLGAFWWLS